MMAPHSMISEAQQATPVGQPAVVYGQSGAAPLIPIEVPQQVAMQSPAPIHLVQAYEQVRCWCRVLHFVPALTSRYYSIMKIKRTAGIIVEAAVAVVEAVAEVEAAVAVAVAAQAEAGVAAVKGKNNAIFLVHPYK